MLLFRLLDWMLYVFDFDGGLLVYWWFSEVLVIESWYLVMLWDKFVVVKWFMYVLGILVYVLDLLMCVLWVI